MSTRQHPECKAHMPSNLCSGGSVCQRPGTATIIITGEAHLTPSCHASIASRRCAATVIQYSGRRLSSRETRKARSGPNGLATDIIASMAGLGRLPVEICRNRVIAHQYCKQLGACRHDPRPRAERIVQAGAGPSLFDPVRSARRPRDYRRHGGEHLYRRRAYQRSSHHII